MDIYKKIFGKTYHFSFDCRYSDLILGSVELYPDADRALVNVSVKISDKITEDTRISQNPAIFLKCRDGIITKFGSCTVKWKKRVLTGPLEIELHMPLVRRGKKALLSRFFSMEFSTPIEAFEQVLHELVLVPSVYFFEDLAVVHSAVLALGDEAILLAGTGGTGKTSALLALRNNNNISFVSDDIAIISKEGKVFPNLAWPKVYGYNLSSYITKAELLKGRGMLDRIQFNYRLKKNPKGVRRKIRPDKLYKNFNSDGVPIKKIVYLFRDSSDEMSVTALDEKIAVKLGINVMKTEYCNFHNHLAWDDYNSLLTKESSVLNLDEIFERWKTNLELAYHGKKVCTLHIPVDIRHEQYLKFMSDFIVSDV